MERGATGTLDIYCTLTTTAGVYKTILFISVDNVSHAALAQGSRLNEAVAGSDRPLHMFPDHALMLSVSLQQKHAPLPATSHNVIAVMEEAGTMPFNNYLAKILFPYLFFTANSAYIVSDPFEPLIAAAFYLCKSC